LAALIISGSDSTAGVSVSPDNAMRVATVYACIRILADSIAQLPVKVYRKNPTGNKETLQGDPLTATLAHAPNSWMTSFEFRELMMTCLCLRGNFYAYINRNAKDDITELLPIMPGAVSLQRNGWKIVYDINLNDTIQRVGQDKIFHVRGLSLNGYEGISPISYQRNAIGLAMATENHGARTFKNGARPGGVLTHPGKLSEDALKNLRESWTATHGGENAGGTAIIEEGMTYANVAMTNEDAQYLDSRSFQRTEICSIFRVPPHMIGDLTKSSFSNITQQSLEFVKYTVLPWSRRIEAAISRDLLSDVQRKQGVYVELLVDGLERADIKTRYEAYKEGIINGWISPNEVRSLENMNPREGGDVYMMPLNMTDSSKKTEPKKEEPQQDIQADEADEGKSVSGDETMARMLMLSMLTKGDEKPVAEQQPQPIINITLPEIFVNNEQKAGEKRKQVHFTRDADGNMISAQVVEEEPK
jgi:HK97 family phage portal protein